MCTRLASETISYYIRNETSVYCWLLDLKKAFDKVQFAKLFMILKDNKFPGIPQTSDLHLFGTSLQSEMGQNPIWDLHGEEWGQAGDSSFTNTVLSLHQLINGETGTIRSGMSRE